jgi:2-polyprenyl-6-methoxyphenol hydroxylase-like FAD-dependent oxidoreductase
LFCRRKNRRFIAAGRAVSTADALIIGGGPAGASAAVRLAASGWKVVLVEQSPFPRQKVCGECLPAGAFALLDELGVGEQVRQLAGPELKRVGWMDSHRILVSAMPACLAATAPFGRAIGRDVLDSLLMERARAAGVEIHQPARVTKVAGFRGNFHCDIAREGSKAPIRAGLIIDAHGSWERGPHFAVPGAPADLADRPARASDLLAFKATFTGTTLDPGLLPVIALPGGYGGMVVSGDGRTTVALCLRRDALRAVRSRNRGMAAGAAVEAFLRECCPTVADVLKDADRQGNWLAVGPLRPGRHRTGAPGIHRIGNAGNEVHPLVGEGIRMALQSARDLALALSNDSSRTGNIGPARWRAHGPRSRVAACYAHIAMRPLLAAPAGRILQRWPALLTTAATLAGKASEEHP